MLQVLAVALAYLVVAASADCSLIGKWRAVVKDGQATYEVNREFTSTTKMTETVKISAGSMCRTNTVSAAFDLVNYQSNFIQYKRTSCSVDMSGCGQCSQATMGSDTFTFSGDCNKVTFVTNGGAPVTYDNTYRPPTPPPTTPVPTTTKPPTNPPATAAPTTAAPPSGGACDHIGTWEITEVVDSGSGVGYAFEFAMVRTYTATTFDDVVKVSMSPAGTCDTNTITSSSTYKLTADGRYTYTTVSCSVDKVGCGSCTEDAETDGTVEFSVSSSCNKLTLVEDGEAMVLNLVSRPESSGSNAGLVIGIIVAVLVVIAIGVAGFLYWRKTKAAKTANFSELKDTEPLAAEEENM